MNLLFGIALKHLLARKRQSFVSLLGIIIGTAFFLAIASLMQGSEKDFIRRLVNNSPHITLSDEFRHARAQPVIEAFPDAAVELRSVKPVTETRGLRGYQQILERLSSLEGLKASPVLTGQALISFAGKDMAVTINGMNPSEIRNVSTIENYMKQGSIDGLIGNPSGLVIGEELARKLSIGMGRTITLVATGGQARTFKVMGIFRTGRASYDETQVFADLKRTQALMGKINRANSIIMKVPDPYQARMIAARIEAVEGYKAVSWQEASEDIMNTLMIRNVITYTIVSAVLVVAAFGIYNVISTVVMEKQRDIAILKSMGFHARDVLRIFIIQGLLLGMAGCLTGVPLGMALMLALMQIRLKPPGGTEMIAMPIDWSWPQFAIAISFALVAALLAALLPARKAAHVQPVDILRGSA